MASVREELAQTRFIHSALIYGSDREFKEVALPFVEEGLDRGEPTLAAVRRRNAESLSSALGGDAERVTLLPVEEWYETSARTREKFARWALDRIGGGRVRLIGEPPWAVGDEAQIRDWARHESVINTVFDGLPVTFICPYDARALPPEIIEHAYSTHPAIVDGDGWTESESYEDPPEFCGRLDAQVRRPAGTPSVDLGFGLADLPRLRQVVRSAAEASGLIRSRAEDLALAVNEIATNAVVHGRLPARLRIWLRGPEIVCEVADSGSGIGDVLAGQLTPQPHGLGGRGLWLSRLICDAVEIRNGSGCTVTLRVSVPRDPVPV
jgi:anti-sigma regulatory factor (Ser/Thr protein kinase)